MQPLYSGESFCARRLPSARVCQYIYALCILYRHIYIYIYAFLFFLLSAASGLTFFMCKSAAGIYKLTPLDSLGLFLRHLVLVRYPLGCGPEVEAGSGGGADRRRSCRSRSIPKPPRSDRLCGKTTSALQKTWWPPPCLVGNSGFSPHFLMHDRK